MGDPLQQYYDTVAQSYAIRTRSRYHHWLNEQSIETLIHWLPTGPILDAGCGCGHIAKPLSAQGFAITAIDQSQEMLRHITLDNEPTDIMASNAVRAAQATIYQMPFATNTFSAAYALRVFPHLTDPRRALCQLAQVVEPGGTIVIDIYNRWSLRTLLKTIHASSSSHPEFSIYTRFDTLETAVHQLPLSLTPHSYTGLRILTPFADLMQLPLAGSTLIAMENLLTRSPLTRFGGFLMLKLTVTDQ